MSATSGPGAQTPTGAAQPPAGPAKTSGLAIAAFVCGLIPFCFINLVGVVLGIVALIVISKRPQALKGQGFAIAGIAVGMVWTVLLVAVAIPNFMKFSARAKQSEAKATLKSIYTAEKSTFAETAEYGATFDAIGWRPEGGLKYSYYLGRDVARADKAPVLPLPPGVESYVGQDSFRAVAVGNIDNDSTPDVWAIDDQNMLENVINDVED
ncbi:MAG: DUF4190 domain-containing protein [Deltaproteobacteria bacterium]|nr:DUF4190 domain-containing protein [Deltaproteobacteria bacterium]